MDKIYSRKRIRISRKTNYNIEKQIKIKKIKTVLIIMLIAFVTVYIITKSVKPIFNGLAIQKARTIATNITNRRTSEVLAKYDYKDLVWIMEDESQKNRILRTDVVKINQIVSEIAIEVEKNLASIQNDKIEIPIGAIIGSSYLAGSGPKIPIKVIPSGNVTTEVITEFETTGINQTVYRIYLKLNCAIKILNTYGNLSDNIKNKVLLVETVIVGEIPEIYYNLEGLNNKDALEILNN